uniref:Uncharacterized protein n=1 Tax=Anguilla anguilla TaxID=7936 RepID=A0A0E9TSU8_ANGAN
MSTNSVMPISIKCLSVQTGPLGLAVVYGLLFKPFEHSHVTK